MICNKIISLGNNLKVNLLHKFISSAEDGFVSYANLEQDYKHRTERIDTSPLRGGVLLSVGPQQHRCQQLSAISLGLLFTA